MQIKIGHHFIVLEESIKRSYALLKGGSVFDDRYKTKDYTNI